LQKQLGLDPVRIIVAGDTGNDRQMFETGYQGVLPVNALDELKAAASESWHYHSTFPAARGVLDGLRYFGLLEG
jgi:hydroxymethylpyrimidine pyrophosphatase-like HAD family hydrolase